MKTLTPIKEIELDTKNLQPFSSIYSIISPIATTPTTTQTLGAEVASTQEMTTRKLKSKVPTPKRPTMSPGKPGQVH